MLAHCSECLPRLGLHRLSWELGSQSRSPACVAGIQVPRCAVAGSWFGSRAGTQAQGLCYGRQVFGDNSTAPLFNC